MASDDEDFPLGDNQGEDKKGNKLVIILLAIIILLFAFAGAGGALYYFGFLDEYIEQYLDIKPEEEEQQLQTSAFMQLDEMLVSVTSNANKQQYLKLKLSLELVKAEDQPAIEGVLPRVIDRFQTFLRELRVEELQGSAGLYRIKEELLTRINLVIRPLRIREVLISDMVLQ